MDSYNPGMMAIEDEAGLAQLLSSSLAPAGGEHLVDGIYAPELFVGAGQQNPYTQQSSSSHQTPQYEHSLHHTYTTAPSTPQYQTDYTPQPSFIPQSYILPSQLVTTMPTSTKTPTTTAPTEPSQSNRGRKRYRHGCLICYYAGKGIHYEAKPYKPDSNSKKNTLQYHIEKEHEEVLAGQPPGHWETLTYHWGHRVSYKDEDKTIRDEKLHSYYPDSSMKPAGGRKEKV